MPRYRRSDRFAALLLAALALAAEAAPAAAVILTVTTAVDVDTDDALCSLREAIVAANTDTAHHGCPAGTGPGDRIRFALLPGAVIELADSLPLVTSSILIEGPGAAELAIDGLGLVPLLFVNSPAGGVTLEIADLTLTRGYGAFPAGGALTLSAGDSALLLRVHVVDNRAENAGGGALLLSSLVDGAATLIVRESLFDGNVAEGPAGGGGIYAAAGSLLTIVRSTFTANRAEAQNGNGGALGLNHSTVEILVSTLSGNRAHGSGGAIFASAGGMTPASLSIADSTITANVAETNGDGDGEGGGIRLLPAIGSTQIFELQSTILAGNADSGFLLYPDLYLGDGAGVDLLTHGFNLLGINAGASALFAAGTPNAALDLVGTLAAPLAAGLEPLGDQGGPLQTHLPVDATGSWIVDQGNCLVTPNDQRGFVRFPGASRAVDDPDFPNAPGGDGCDIGAVELGAIDPGNVLFTDGLESGDLLLWSAAFP